MITFWNTNESRALNTVHEKRARNEPLPLPVKRRATEHIGMNDPRAEAERSNE